MKTVLILVGSPRRDGNSSRLARQAEEGVIASGNIADLVFVDDFISHFLRDCRQCRGADGECRIRDRYRELFVGKYVPADGILFATPLYWYGMSGQLKTFFDRSFCYYAASHPDNETHIEGMVNKRLGT